MKHLSYSFLSRSAFIHCIVSQWKSTWRRSKAPFLLSLRVFNWNFSIKRQVATYLSIILCVQRRWNKSSFHDLRGGKHCDKCKGSWRFLIATVFRVINLVLLYEYEYSHHVVEWLPCRTLHIVHLSRYCRRVCAVPPISDSCDYYSVYYQIILQHLH